MKHLKLFIVFDDGTSETVTAEVEDNLTPEDALDNIARSSVTGGFVADVVVGGRRTHRMLYNWAHVRGVAVDTTPEDS